MLGTSELSVQRFDAPVGAEIIGVDAAHDIDAGTVAKIKDALNRNFVVVLRNQKLSGDDLARFGSHLGVVY